jgi:hypothetical protein
MLTGVSPSGTLTLTNPARYRVLAVLASSGCATNAEQGKLVVEFTDGTTHDAAYDAFDWEVVGRRPAVAIMGRNGEVGDGTRFTYIRANYEYGMFETRITLPKRLQSKLVKSVRFERANGAETTGIFAISGIPSGVLA